MTHEPRPLPEGTLLADRFEVGAILGKGAFGIVYLARDLERNDNVVIKELAPDGTHRREDLLLDLPAAMAHRLRRNFLNEAKTMSRLNVRGVLPVRLGFVENGTAYFATDYLPNATTLEKLLQREGRMDFDGALDIFYQVLEILEGVHAKGILHRDLKPSNILLSPAGEATLIDFGAAREWHADSSITHTVLFTPNYAPLEQMAERARRGPATDLYALCATVYEMLSGRKPESATERASGVALTPLLSLRPEIDPSIANAIEMGLALKYSDRPQSVQAMRDQLAHIEEPAAVNTLFELDARMVRLQRFSFERRQCPVCSGLLDEPRPLRKGVCPVCHEGTIKKREIHPGKCPSCRTTVLKRIHNLDPMRTCPSCRKGWLQIRKKGLLSKEILATCPLCEAEFAGTQTEANGRSWSDFLAESGRSEYVSHCDNCRSQFDELADGRMQAVVSNGNLKYDRLYPEEWDCVAAGLEPGTGNAECLVCSADFYVDGDQVTLLATKDDPYGFAKEHLGRLLTFEDNRWMAVGKFSPKPGLVCLQCATEFDKDGDYFRLVRTHSRKLQSQIERPFKLVDWHRLTQDLPLVEEEAEFADQFNREIVKSYERSELGFDDQNSVLWRGPAINLDNQAHGTLQITKDEFQFGGVFKKAKLPFDTIRAARVQGDIVSFLISGEAAPFDFKVENIDLTVHLQSGMYTVELGPHHLAGRFNKERLA